MVARVCEINNKQIDKTLLFYANLRNRLIYFFCSLFLWGISSGLAFRNTIEYSKCVFKWLTSSIRYFKWLTFCRFRLIDVNNFFFFCSCWFRVYVNVKKKFGYHPSISFSLHTWYQAPNFEITSLSCITSFGFFSHLRQIQAETSEACRIIMIKLTQLEPIKKKCVYIK